ncbi:MAG: serine hydrolase domain-containing protein [Steroidobacteraceae bacterium]
MQRRTIFWKVFLITVAFGAMPLAAAELPTATPESVGMSATRLSRLDAAMQADIAAGRLPGIVVAVARRGKVVYQKAFGVANLTTREPLRTDALFRLYSMTKAITSVGLLTLYEQGKFRLTDPLDRYLPQFANLKVYKGADASGNPILASPARKPTIQDAFRHTLGLASGLGQSPVDALYRQAGLGMGQLDSVAQEVDKLGTMPLLYEPGEQWVYGLAHDVQARLIEVFSGMSYADYMQKTLFGPLGMRDTVFGVPARLKPRFPMVYSARPDRTLVPDTADEYIRYTDHHFGTLSLSATARDYLRFGQMLLNEGELDGVRILGTKTVELMRQNHLPPNIPSIAPGSTATGWGLGVSVTLNVPALGRLNSVGSYGWGGAATTLFSVDPEEHLTYVIMAQLMPNDSALMQRVETLIYQAIID